MLNKNLLNKAYEKAKETIKICETKHGLYASGGKHGYKGVWARDSMVSLIGACSDNDISFKKQMILSLNTLKKAQSENGQIPNAVHGYENKKIQIDYSSIDSSLWFIIGHYFYKKRFKNSDLFKKHKKAIEKAFIWLDYHDIGEDGVLRQLPTTDWQDAFPEKYGATINIEAMHYHVLNLMGKKKEAIDLKKLLNDQHGKRLWENDFYLAYRWKNHNKYKEEGDWFDSLGNLLAIIFDLADKKRAEKILNYMKRKRISLPYPTKAIDPPITKKSDYWEDYYLDCEAGHPHHYLNGGIWPFIGGFYVLALIKTKKFKEAEKALKSLAEANLKSNIFPEWIDPISKETHGIYQAWSAGMYICAYNSLKKKKVLF